MNEYSVIIHAVAVVFSIIGIGVVLRRTGFISTDLDRALTRLIINLFFPCLIFSKIVGNQALFNVSNLFWAPLVGFTCVAGGYLIAYVISPFIGLGEKADRGAFTLSVGTFNYGFIPIPIAMALFDDETVGTLFLHNVGVEIALWSLGIALLTGRFDRTSLKRLINPPLCCIVVSVLLTLSGAHRFVPPFIFKTTDVLGGCAVPVSLLMIGLTIGNYLTTHPKLDSLRIAIPGCILRLALLPALMLGLAFVLPISQELKRIIALQVAMPSAVFPILLASHLNGNTQTALRVVLSTSLLSVVTLPLWLTLSLRLIGE